MRSHNSSNSSGTIIRECKNRIAPFLKSLVENRIYDFNFGGINIRQKGGADFFRRFVHRPTHEEKFLSGLNLFGKTIYDIGGYLGIVATFFALKSGSTGRVIVFEPNPQNCKKIDEIIRLNNCPQVTLIPQGLGCKEEKCKMAVRRNLTAIGSMDEKIKKQIIVETDSFEIDVTIDSLDHLMDIYNFPKPDFIKIDNEGMEYSTLIGSENIVKKWHPLFYIELHGAEIIDKIENIKQISSLFKSWEYSVRHVESGSLIDENNVIQACLGHIFCTPK